MAYVFLLESSSKSTAQHIQGALREAGIECTLYQIAEGIYLIVVSAELPYEQVLAIMQGASVDNSMTIRYLKKLPEPEPDNDNSLDF